MKQNQQELKNKLVVVAGGAGEIGERITRMFLQQGARVLVPSRSKEKLEALGASLKDISTGELIPLETDVSTPQGLKTLLAGNAHRRLCGNGLSLLFIHAALEKHRSDDSLVRSTKNGD
jgi:NADP-dependent 3-hydroxy acid dehydrogenase YdfG